MADLSVNSPPPSGPRVPQTGPVATDLDLRAVGRRAVLAEVAELWDTDVDGVVARLGRVELVAAFCGFAPGFAYLAGLGGELAVPRLDAPRPQVPPGSVAVADRWCGIYPTGSPGGWRLLGHTALTLWDPAGDPPALLAPGTRVRLAPA